MNEQQCNTVNEQVCNTVQEQQCSTVQEQECSTVNEQQVLYNMSNMETIQSECFYTDLITIICILVQHCERGEMRDPVHGEVRGAVLDCQRASV